MSSSGKPRTTLNPPVFYTSAALILLLVLYAVLFKSQAQTQFEHIQQWIFTNASWF